jgi:hypothetical protein
MPMDASFIPTQQILVHNEEGEYLMDKNKWPTLVIQNKQELLAVQENSQEGQLTDEEGDWVKPPSKKKKTKPRDGVPIAEKAARRAQERDEVPSNPFTILNDHSTDTLRKIATDLDVNDSFLDENLDAIKVEELVRDDFAQAQYRAYLANLRNREIPPGEEDSHCLG